ncbi:hypothetical protein CHUAL_002234 [Chamberlinius hualienensis]
MAFSCKILTKVPSILRNNVAPVCVSSSVTHQSRRLNRKVHTAPPVDTQQQRSRLHQEVHRVQDENTSKIIRASFSDVNIPNVPLVDYVLKGIENYYDDTALVCGMTGRSYTYADVEKYIQKIGSALNKRGFRKGDVFAIISPNIPEYSLLYLGVAAIGGIITTANPLYTAEEIARQLNNCQAKFVMTVPMFGDLVLQAVTQCPSVKESFIAGEAEGYTSMMHLALDDGDKFPTVSIQPDDVICMPYSSGTTGLPKGVMLTHRNLCANIAQISHPGVGFTFTPQQTLMNVLPMFHIYGMMVGMMLGLQRKIRTVTLPKFDPQMFIDALREYKPTCLPLVPPIISFLAKSPLMKSNDFDSVEYVICGAAPVGVSIANAFMEKIHPHRVEFLEGYGMTETSPVTLFNPRNATKIGTCGVLMPNTEAKVVDVDSGESLGPMQPGELWVRGPQVMKGYYKNDEATRNTIDADGWLHTGDVAIYDENEYFSIIDRLKELIKVKGLQVSPSELENILLKHSSIQDAAVIGIPDERCGELPRAYIVSSDANLTSDDVATYVEAQVAPHKALKGGIEFVNAIPKTTTGKILHRTLRQQYLEQLNKS